MRSREVEYRVPVAERQPGCGEAEDWLGGHGYERGGGWTKLAREAAVPDQPEDPEIEVFELEVFAELGESDRDSLAAAHNLTEAGFVEALPLPADTRSSVVADTRHLRV